MMIGVVAAVALGVTGAYFSDTETSEGNVIQAGSLDLKVKQGDVYVDLDPTHPALIELTDMKPSMPFEREILLQVLDNPGYLWKHIIIDVDGNGGCDCETNGVTEPECTEQGGTWTADGECEGLNLESDNNNLFHDTDFDLYVDDKAIVELEDGISVEDIASCWIPLGHYNKLDEVKVKQSFHLRSDVTNWAQSDKCTFSEVFAVSQENNPGPPSTLDRIWDPNNLKCVDCTNNEAGFCDDGFDNDCDGLVDTNDPDCFS